MEFYDVSEDVVADYLSHSGEAKDIPDSEFDPVKLAVGVLVEVEHADDFDVAKEIAKDHLVEDGDYYGKYIFPDEAIERIEDEVVSYEDDSFRSGLADLPLSDDGPDPGLAYLSYDLPEDDFGFVDNIFCHKSRVPIESLDGQWCMTLYEQGPKGPRANDLFSLSSCMEDIDDGLFSIFNSKFFNS